METLPDYPIEFPDSYPALRRLHAWHTAHRDAPGDLSEDDRRRFNRGLQRVAHPVWEEGVQTGLDLILAPKTDVKYLAIGGPAKSGKTSLAKQIAMQVCDLAWADGHEYEQGHATYKIVPVIFCKAAHSEAKDLMRDILRGFGIAPTGTANDMLSVFRTRCEQHQVRMICIDDVHNSSTRSTSLINFYKRFIDLVPATVVCTAVDFETSPLRRPDPRADSAINDLLAQTFERQISVTLEAVVSADRKSRGQFGAALKAMVKSLRLHRQQESDLLTPPATVQLLNKYNAKIGACLEAIANAGAQAVGNSEQVGTAELHLRPGTPARPS